MTQRRTFSGTAASVREARRFVRDAIGSVPESIGEAVAIAASELATNSVRHAGTDFTVEVERTAEWVRIGVRDTGGGVPTLRLPPSSEPTGRGLLLVRELADDWGVDEPDEGPGKCVWFAIRVTSQRDEKGVSA